MAPLAMAQMAVIRPAAGSISAASRPDAKWHAAAPVPPSASRQSKSNACLLSDGKFSASPPATPRRQVQRVAAGDPPAT